MALLRALQVFPHSLRRPRVPQGPTWYHPSPLWNPLPPPFPSVCPSLPASMTSLPCFQHSKPTTNMEPSCLLLLMSTTSFPQLSAGLLTHQLRPPQKCHLTRASALPTPVSHLHISCAPSLLYFSHFTCHRLSHRICTCVFTYSPCLMRIEPPWGQFVFILFTVVSSASTMPGKSLWNEWLSLLSHLMAEGQCSTQQLLRTNRLTQILVLTHLPVINASLAFPEGVYFFYPLCSSWQLCDMWIYTEVIRMLSLITNRLVGWFVGYVTLSPKNCSYFLNVHMCIKCY